MAGFDRTNTKALFAEQGLLTVHCLYYKHTLLETFKILKYRAPIGLHQLFHLAEKRHKESFRLSPSSKIKSTIAEHNFVAKASAIWNFFVNDVLVSNKINENIGYIIPGETSNSDLSSSIAFIKEKTTRVLIDFQSRGLDSEWEKKQFELSNYTS